MANPEHLEILRGRGLEQVARTVTDLLSLLCGSVSPEEAIRGSRVTERRKLACGVAPSHLQGSA